jgi:probable F420-dependent oxidoreductase
MVTNMELGKIGVWTGQVRALDLEALAEIAATIETLGYRALWIPGGAGGAILERCEAALGGTSSLVLATGILNIWRHDATEVAATTARLNNQHGGRLLLGLGVSHERLIKEEYVAPLAKMTAYLDQLDEAGQPPEVRVLAALRRRMLDLARNRAAGAHPYFVPPEHTEAARVILGPGRLLAPEQTVVLETDPGEARRLARAFCTNYLGLPNYVNNLRTLGYTDDDLTPPGSDRLVDAIVVWGDEATIADRVQTHLNAGADHVCIQVIESDNTTVPLDAWRRLAPALLEIAG